MLAIETFPYTYWLDSLRYFCAGKQTACLVQTKMDIGESIPVDSKVKADFRIPADTPRVSAKSAFEKIKPFDRKFEDFKDALFTALKAAKGKYPFSDKWLLIKNELRKLAKTKPVLTRDAYVAFCEKLRPNINYKKKDQSYSMLDTLTDYLHETGVILYFRNIDELRDKVFIRPDWVTDAIYQVLDYAVMRNNGMFDLEHVARVFPDLDAHDLIRIMEKFEIIFPVNNKEGYYLAPQYFSDKNPRENPDGNYYKLLAQSCTHLQFVLRFPQFLPRSVITRFMCKYEQSPTIETVGGDYIAVEDLSKLVHLKGEISQETNRPKIFISYAHADGESFKNKIITHLEALRRQERIERWDDRMITSGEWSPQLESALAAADIFLLVITPGFLESDYIHAVEIKMAYQKYKAGRAKIFPVICDYCDWPDYPIADDLEMHPVSKRMQKVWLGKFQPFPTNGEPVKVSSGPMKTRLSSTLYASLKRKFDPDHDPPTHPPIHRLRPPLRHNPRRRRYLPHGHGKRRSGCLRRRATRS
ncbi:MAG: TIR domain-containing protein [Lewinellaceae bacterium]|nr:TIR domain-containing protein [Lewinellaceae bacterium]